MGSDNGCSMDENDELWQQLRYEAKLDADAEPALASYLYATILVHRTMEQALAYHLGNKLSNPILSGTLLYNLVVDVLTEAPEIRDAIRIDMRAVREKDPACDSYCHCLLNFKGFLACQAHRVAHKLWSQGRIPLALAIQSRTSEVFSMDIHPAAKIGNGVLFDHGTGVVIGETASIGDNVSILHHVTVGGTGKQGGDRHPKIGNGVLIGAGATILGNVNSSPLKPTCTQFHQKPLPAATKVLTRFTIQTPSWAAKTARRIDFWSDLVESKHDMNLAADSATGIFSSDLKLEIDLTAKQARCKRVRWEDLGATELKYSSRRWVTSYLKELQSRLRNGGWKEEDICDVINNSMTCSTSSLHLTKICVDRQNYVENLATRFDVLSGSLRKGGWSPKDIVECFHQDAIYGGTPRSLE